jgi:predicted unusual protein kinase regulating ubiquinone biosynthesis (AarF/ABC1/UbiB family)
MHGDLHSANIIVTEKGIGLIDFGICTELSVKQLISILSIQQYESKPSFQTISNMISVMVKTVMVKTKQKLIEEVYQVYTTLFLETKEPIPFSTLFSIISKLVRTHGLMIRGEVCSYLSTLFLLEEMSPYPIPQYSTYLAIKEMKTDPFFSKECGNGLDFYLGVLSKKFKL